MEFATDTSTAETLLQQPILFDEIIDCLKLPTIDPASEQRQEEVQRLERSIVVSIAGYNLSSASALRLNEPIELLDTTGAQESIPWPENMRNQMLAAITG